MIKFIKAISFIALAVAFTGCGGFESGGSQDNLSELESPRQVSPARKVVAILSQRQFLPNFTACTGLPADQISQQTRDEVAASIGNLSPEGGLDQVQGSMLMAFVKVGAEICNDLISHEQGLDSRRFFGGFNLGNDRANETFDVKRTVASLASSCWGRQATPTEVDMVAASAANTSISNDEGRNMALYVCTAVLGSSAAVKF